MAAVSSRSPPSSPRPDARHSSSPISRRRAACAPRRRKAVIYVLNGIAPGSAPPMPSIDARPVIGSMSANSPNGTRSAAPRLARRRRPAFRHRHEPARPADRRGAGARRPRAKMPDHGIALVMSHLACAETPATRSTSPDPRRSASCAIMFRGVSGIARQFLRHLPRSVQRTSTWCGRASRSTASIRRRHRQPDARRWSSSRPGSCRCAIVEPRRDRRLRRDLDRHSARRASRSYRSAMRDGYSAAPIGFHRRRRGRRPPGGRRRPALPRHRARVDGPDGDRHHRADRGRARRGDCVTLIGDGIGVDEVAGWAGTIGYEVLTASVAATTGCGRGRRFSITVEPWHATPRPSSARTAAPSTAAGRASASPAASGTRSSRKAPPPSARPPAPAAPPQGPAVRARAARRRDRMTPRASPPASPSSTASPAAASCAARCCWSAAIPASASRRC